MNIHSATFRYLVQGLIACTPVFSARAWADATVTATGFAYCYDGTTQLYYPMEGLRVELMDSDCHGSEICDDEMGRSRVQADGSFTVTGSGGDPGWIGSGPDVYLRFAYNDDEGVRLTDELNSTRSWSTPSHDHDNTGDGTTIDFGSWSTGNGVGPGEGTQCGVWRNGRLAFQAYIAEIHAQPPAGHLDIEYWSAIYAGTPWTNTDTVHWPIHYGSSAMPHEFGHSIRHAADGDGNHFNLDVTRFQYARTHSMCASDGNRNPSESDYSLRGYAFNEGWAEYWAGTFWGCGTSNRDVEGNIAHILRLLQTQNGLTRGDMVSVLVASPGGIHSLDEFIRALEQSHVGINTSALTATPPAAAAVDFAPYSEAERAHQVASQISQISRQLSNLRSQAAAYRSAPEGQRERRCKNCEDVFQRAVAPALLQGQAEVLEVWLRALKRASGPEWALQVQRELNAGRYPAYIESYRSELRGAMRRMLLESLRRAQGGLREIQSSLSPAAFYASLTTLAKASARLQPDAVMSPGTRNDPAGWLPQLALAEDQARAAVRGGAPNSKEAPISPSEASLSVPANVTWVDTGITVSRGQHLVISAKGIWSNAGPPAQGPKGFENYRYPGTVLANADLASLIARVGEAVFAVGDTFDGASPASGVLYLSINDTPATFDDNQGALSVQVSKY